MQCTRIHRLLSAYHDAELPAEARYAVRQHLRGCDACRQALESVKSLEALGEKWAQIQAPGSLWEALAVALDTACKTAGRETAIEAAAREDQRRSKPRRTFKPVVEGLEDRFPPSALVGVSVLSFTPAPAAFAAAWAAL